MKKPIILISILSLFLPLAAHAYLDKTHKQVAREAVKLIEQVGNSADYEEIYKITTYQEPMYDGAVEQDYGSVQGNQRGMRHYFDPDAPPGKQGCPYKYFYPMWQIKDLLEKTAKESFGIYWEKNTYVDVKEPPGGYYESALEWARDSGGGKDLNNWKSAIRTYDYTESSRAEAYRRLGHVIHLLSDCAEPDHALNLPHPGSDRVAGFQDAVLTASPQRAVTGTYYGFERFVDEVKIPLNPIRVERRDTFDKYFIGLARLSKRKLKQSGLEAPLGLKKTLINYGPVKAVEIYWTPTIDMDDKKMVGKYIKLTRAVLDPAVEYCAGLMKDFHDIVNQPPYLAEIKITQDAEIKYHAAWKESFHEFPQDKNSFARAYIRVLDRSPDIKVKGKTLSADEEATLHLIFGPTAAPKEWIDINSLKAVIGINTISGFDRLDESTFIGTFTPRLPEKVRKKENVIIEVYAKDHHQHYPRKGLPAEGYALDSKPATPADVGKLEPPYTWKDYEPGPDRNHTITIERKSSPPIVRSIKLLGQGSVYADSTWVDIKKSQKRKLKEGTNVFHGGINIAEVKKGKLIVTFDQEIDGSTLSTSLGKIHVPMKHISGTRYEGRIDFT
ncbi:MAG: hypothetical protein JRF25_08065, partial [Deltaproteobacteria bacterium]|nr:hypothetical protein [Deltaproteobacteria bacterium]